MSSSASAAPDLTDRQLLNAFGQPVMAVGPDNQILKVNDAAQQFFLRSERGLLKQNLEELLAGGTKIIELVNRAREIQGSFTSYDIALQLSPDRSARVDVQVAVIVEQPQCVFLALEPRTIADQMSQQSATQNAARAASGVASMLAHEVKNPLSGIRGAAQLIEDSLPLEEAPLAQLIVKETDRIAELVEQMEIFSDSRPAAKTKENIHQILDHVIAVASSGLSAGLALTATYDPSLPDIKANWGQLVQVYLNLILNAAEAAPADGGQIIVKTAYRTGTRVMVPEQTQPISLPIEVTVTDNGDGVPEPLRESMFDPFVSGKTNGKGLGLALAAKIITEHDGFIGYQRRDGRTVFRTLLPALRSNEAG